MFFSLAILQTRHNRMTGPQVALLIAGIVVITAGIIMGGILAPYWVRTSGPVVVVAGVLIALTPALLTAPSTKTAK
jgi:hypothetical protein